MFMQATAPKQKGNMKKSRRANGTRHNGKPKTTAAPKQTDAELYRGKWWTNADEYAITVEPAVGWEEAEGYTVGVRKKPTGFAFHTLAVVFAKSHRTDDEARRIATEIAADSDYIDKLRNRREPGIIDRRRVFPGGLVPMVWEEPEEGGDPDETGEPRVTLMIEPPGGKPAVEVQIIGDYTDDCSLMADDSGFTDDFVLVDRRNRKIVIGRDAGEAKIGSAIWRAIYTWGDGSDAFEE